ncbi:protein kinase [Micromonospora sp. NPDC002389]|uniref:protein kinase domain-containing protein n=1 Tax=Micromonospora sp. NPDC002389 TaxID=3154272 RepID=UPI0033301ACA
MEIPAMKHKFIGRYRLDQPISRGSFGEVWRAYDDMTERFVAIKIFGSSSAQSDPMLPQFMNEIRAASQLDHPNIVKVYDFIFLADRRPAMVMQYIPDGLTLNDIIAENSLTSTEIARIGATIASALSTAHRSGVIHGDVKPSNILIGKDEHIALADFGIARFSSYPPDRSSAQNLTGTPLFMAPELIEGSQHSSASDVWALGVTLYSALEDASPFSGNRIDVLFEGIRQGEIRPFTRRTPLSAVILRMLAQDPPRRPSASEAETLLREVAGGREQNRGRPTVRTRGFGDSPSKQDLLGRNALVDVLTDLLSLTDDGHAESANHTGPQVITVDGPWGSGKTTVMRLIKDRLDLREHDWRLKDKNNRKIIDRLTSLKRNARFTPVEAHRILGSLARLKTGTQIAQTYKLNDPHREKRPPATALFEPWSHQSSEQVWAGFAKTINHAAVQAMFDSENAQHRFWFAQNAARIDRSRLRRHLRQSVTSPLLKFSVIALIIPAAIQLLKLDSNGAASKLTTIAWAIPLFLIALGIIHTTLRYFLGRADAFLPEELFKGPVLSGTLSAPNNEPTIRDPLHHAQSGSLYLFQHDVKVVLDALYNCGLELVIFVDDLDRCGPQGSVEVLQALNLFLSGTLKACRLVIGLDQTIVAAQLDEVYGHIAKSNAVRYGQDPSAGWTFLRKLTHLPITLPRVRDEHVDLYLADLLGPVATSDELDPPSLGTEAADAPPRANPWLAGRKRLFLTSTVAESERTTIYALESHPEIREFLRSRIQIMGDLSGREAKRTLTLWQFYLRLLLRTTPDMSISNGVEMGKPLAIFAEIFTRWPAMTRALSTNVDGNPGLVILIDRARNHIEWEIGLSRLHLDGPPHRSGMQELRKLLLEQDSHQIRKLAAALL